MNLLSKELDVAVFVIFGHQVASVISMVVIVQICNQLMRMDGSGRDPVLKLDQLVFVAMVIGVILEVMVKLNQIIGKQLKYAFGLSAIWMRLLNENFLF